MSCPGKKKKKTSQYLSGKRINPKGLTGREKLSSVIEEAFLAYNAARLREACLLFTRKMLDKKTTIGMSLAGALTPAGLGASCVVPLIKAGFVDWIVSTGANLYHDLHFAFNLPLHMASPALDDVLLREEGVVRIYDIVFDWKDTLCHTDDLLMEILHGPEFQKEMSSSELHYLLGKYAAEYEKQLGLKNVSVLAAAYRAGVPIYTSSPGDSTIGLNAALLNLEGNKHCINPSLDVNESASLVYNAKKSGGRSGVLLFGGGSPKNFVLQTEPHIQEILKLEEVGHDYFLQFTDARPDTGGLSGATPAEAVSWGKIDPDQLPDAVVCYVDTTIAMPLLTHYALSTADKRKPKKLYCQRDVLLEKMRNDFRNGGQE